MISKEEGKKENKRMNKKSIESAEKQVNDLLAIWRLTAANICRLELQRKGPIFIRARMQRVQKLLGNLVLRKTRITPVLPAMEPKPSKKNQAPPMRHPLQ